MSQDFHFLRLAKFRLEAGALFFEALAREALTVVVIQNADGLRNGFEGAHLLACVAAGTIGHADYADNFRAFENRHSQKTSEQRVSLGGMVGMVIA